MRATRVLIAVAATALLVPAGASAINYPPPSKPSKPSVRPKHTKTLHVCKTHRRHCYRSISSAVRHAHRGDTIRIAAGVYREGVTVKGHRYDWLRLIGDTRHPSRVRLDGATVHGPAAANGIKVEGADNVTIAGMEARHYKGNGFFAVNVTGYLMTHLIADRTGAYGLYAFNSFGGRMSYSTAYYNNDSGFYIGQTPVQVKPRRSYVEHVRAWGNVLGFSGTNMRYVTIRYSEFFNNGLGIVPNALVSEKFPPPSGNTIYRNRIFWNNFNYFKRAPFKLRASATGDIPYPIGTGVLLFGSRDTHVMNNQIFGNWLIGVGMIPQILIDPAKDCTQDVGCVGDPDNTKASPPAPEGDVGTLLRNQVSGNLYGYGGKDLNGRDAYYDGSGYGNCFGFEPSRRVTEPADGHTFTACGSGQANVFDPLERATALSWVVDDDNGTNHGKHWIRHGHTRIRDILPLVLWSPRYRGPGEAPAAPRRHTTHKPKPKPRPKPPTGSTSTVHIGDYYFRPGFLSVNAGSSVRWVWPSSPGDQHNVTFTSTPSGVKHYRSATAASDYTYTLKLTKPGTYRYICTIHPSSMRGTVVVK